VEARSLVGRPVGWLWGDVAEVCAVIELGLRVGDIEDSERDEEVEANDGSPADKLEYDVGFGACGIWGLG
jgi:hypothetical protein